MLGQDHLSLRSVRLSPLEEWVHQQEGLLFVFHKGGMGRFIAGQFAGQLAPGDVMVLNGRPPRRFGPNNANEIRFQWFSIQFEHLFPLFGTDELCLLQSVIEAFKGLRLYSASSPIAAECHKLIEKVPANVNLDHRAQLVRVAASVLSEEFHRARPQRFGFARGEEQLSQAFEKLSVDQILNFSVIELASHFNCSRRHLNRLFHQRFGLSVTGLRMELRLLRAASLFRDPAAKVSTVAVQCGFNHLGLFNTCFKRRFGVTPGQWREQVPTSTLEAASRLPTKSNCCLLSTGLCPWSRDSAEPGPLPVNGQFSDCGATLNTVNTASHFGGDSFPKRHLTRGSQT